MIERPSGIRRAVLLLAILAAGVFVPTDAQQPPQTGSSPASASATQSGQTAAQNPAPSMPRGEKLFLKDGSYQLVREYRVEGDRVRYYSLDSRQWEEVPYSLVDWDATQKEAAAESQRADQLLKSVEKQEKERNAESLDIDASIQIAPGVFLPQGNGLFVFDGKKIYRMSQAKTEGQLSKGHELEQVLVPIPIIPTRFGIYLRDPHAEFRVPGGQPEFYLRTAEPDQPDLDLVRTKTKGDRRQIENLDELFGAHRERRHSIPVHIWQMADGLYRITVEADLPPGDYAVLEALRGANGEAADERGELNLYVWDFGVEASQSPPAQKTK